MRRTLGMLAALALCLAWLPAPGRAADAAVTPAPILRQSPAPAPSPSPEPTPSPTPRPQSIDFTFPSRQVQVYATATVPFGEGPFPLVLMLNGHGEGRNDNAGFRSIAMWLAEQGMATVRVDFPGCGDSVEPFTKNSQSNMKEDILGACRHMLSSYPIDAERIGAFGFSMGGRLILELIVDEAVPFKAIVLVAPAADTDDLRVLFGGRDHWQDMKEEANQNEKGYDTYVTPWGQEYQLGKEWFRDLEKYEGRSLIDKASRKYAGPSLVIYAVNDDVVSPHVSRAVADALRSQMVITPIDGHSYGFFSNKYLLLHLVETSAVTFFSYNLREDAPAEALHPLMNGGPAIVISQNQRPVNLRREDSLKAKLLRRIPHGAMVRVLEEGAEWSLVRYQGREGYVQTAFLQAAPQEE